MVYIRQNKYEEAEKIAKMTMDIALDIYGESHSEYANTLRVLPLSVIYIHQEKLKEDEVYSEYLLKVCGKAFGKVSEEYCDAADRLSNKYLGFDKYDVLEKLNSEIIEIKEKLYKDNNTKIIFNLNCLAFCYFGQGRYKEAEKIYIRVLDIIKESGENKISEYIDALTGIAKIYEEEGRENEAEILLIKALEEVDKKFYGNNSIMYVRILDILGGFYKRVERYKNAEKTYLKALNIRKNTKWETMDIQLASDGSFLYWDSINEKREISNEIDGTYKLENIKALAELYETMYRYDEAEGLYKEILDEIEKTHGKESRQYVIELMNLATFFKTEKKYEESEKHYIKALEIEKEIVGEGTKVYCMINDYLTSLYEEIGNNIAAEEGHKKTMEIAKVAYNDSSILNIPLLKSIGINKVVNGKEEEGRTLLYKALDIARDEKSLYVSEYAEVLNEIAYSYTKNKEWEKAKKLYESALNEAVELFHVDSLNHALILKGFGDLYKDMERHGEGEKLYIEALNKFESEESQKKNPKQYISLFNSLGSLYEISEQYLRAKETYLNALEEVKKLFGTENKYYLQFLDLILNLYLECDIENELIEKTCSDILNIALKIYRRENIKYVDALEKVAYVYLKMKKEKEAVDLIIEALNIENNIITDTVIAMSEEKRLQFIEDSKGRLDRCFSVILKCNSISNEDISRVYEIILFRKGLGAEILMAQKDTILSGKYPKLKEKFEKLNNLRLKIARKTLNISENIEDIARVEREIQGLKNKRDRIENEIAGNIPEMEVSKKLENANKNDIKTLIGEDSALIEILKIEGDEEEERYIAFTLVKEEEISLVDLGCGKEIDGLINSFRQSIKDGEGDFKEIGEGLKKLLINPILKKVEKKKRLIFSTDGELTQIPFQIIPFEEGYLVNYYEISYVNASRDMLRETVNTSADEGEALVIAYPEYKLDGEEIKDDISSNRALNLDNLRFQPLPYTKIEGILIGRKLGINPVMKKEASKKIVKKAKSPKILHIATHGFFMEKDEKSTGLKTLTNPLLRSGLALAGAQSFIEEKKRFKDAEDGILTAEDVSCLDLIGTDLVVLSACETGMGEVRTGEGVFGFRRAFTIAGAKTLIMSLWEVDDIATAILMDRFYENIIEKCMGYNIALREAQIYLKGLTKKEIKESILTREDIEEIIPEIRAWYEKNLSRVSDKNKPFIHPYYWGGFICQGDIVNKS